MPYDASRKGHEGGIDADTARTRLAAIDPDKPLTPAEAASLWALRLYAPHQQAEAATARLRAEEARG